jgi:hypothetical protein
MVPTVAAGLKIGTEIHATILGEQVARSTRSPPPERERTDVRQAIAGFLQQHQPAPPDGNGGRR